MSGALDAERLDRVYTQLAEAIGRVGDERTSLFLATLVLELVAGGIEPDRVAAAIARCERLTAL